jgi:hypothetical protein
MAKLRNQQSYDPYLRLRTPTPTPSDEICTCTDNPPVKLMTALGFNPIHCMRCNLEVPPEALPLPPDLVDPLADWAQVHDALDHLWLDSGPYESWAFGELTNPSSATNTRGIAVRLDIDRVRRCYYWLEELPRPELRNCSACRSPLTPFLDGRIEQLVCEPCSLVFGISAA